METLIFRDLDTRHVERAYEKVPDNHMNYWRALRNQYCPATYVIDGQGRIRDRLVG